MSLELSLNFPNPNQAIVSFNRGITDPFPFKSPLLPEDLQEIRWYLEVYAAQYTTEIDDRRADRIAQQLPV